jgi:hypothetical protein
MVRSYTQAGMDKRAVGDECSADDSDVFKGDRLIGRILLNPQERKGTPGSRQITALESALLADPDSAPGGTKAEARNKRSCE